MTPIWGCPVGLFQQVIFGRAGVGCPGKMRIPVFPVRERCSLKVVLCHRYPSGPCWEVLV